VGGVHPGLDLEYERAERLVDLALVAVRGRGGRRRGGERHEGAQQLRDPEVEDRRGEQDRGGLSGEEELLVVLGAIGLEQVVGSTAFGRCSSRPASK
jgi:hypothetical protein